MIKIGNIGQRIREIRKSKNLTMLELGNRIGITENNISRYERGIIKDIPFENINKIAEALEVDLYYLLTGEVLKDINKYIYEIEPMLKKIKLSKENKKVISYSLKDAMEIQGVNSKVELALISRVLRERKNI